jgi:hypothetical protein
MAPMVQMAMGCAFEFIAIDDNGLLISLLTLCVTIGTKGEDSNSFYNPFTVN